MTIVHSQGPDDRIAKPTIDEALAEFLAEQRKRLGSKTFAQYDRVVGLLRSYLNNYAYSSLHGPDAKLYDELYEADGDAHREFCEVFGPEQILPNVGQFLSYFMVRKVFAGKGLLRASGTVTKKLATWLATRGYADAEEAKYAAERGGMAARELPRTEELAERLNDLAEGEMRGDEVDVNEGHFVVRRVERGKLWLESFLDGRQFGPVAVPVDISASCQVGWRISGAVGRRGRKWRIVEAWNVYPSLLG